MAVTDWKKMKDKLVGVVAEIDARPPPLPPEELAEGKAFLSWLADDHYTLLAYRCHDLVVVDGQDALRIVPGSSLGFLREAPTQNVATSFSALPPEVRAYARYPDLLIVTKANARSTVHRPGYLDYVGVKRFDAAGNVCGEHRFLGLYTSTAYSASPADIPLLRRKTANVVARAGVARGSHAGKALLNILANYPRDELFQTSEDDLLRTATGILHLGERQRFRLFVRRDPFERFLVCLIYAPRETYTTELREKWQAILLAAFNGIELGIQRPSLRVRAGARDDHGAHRAGQDPGVRRPRAGGAARARGAALGRRSQGCADRRARRGARQRAPAPFRRRRCRPPIARISPRARRCPTSR